MGISNFRLSGFGVVVRLVVVRLAEIAASVALLIAPANAASGGCQAISGVWNWFNGATVVISAGGRVTARGRILNNQGSWTCIDRQIGRIRINWEQQGWIDTLTLSEDG